MKEYRANFLGHDGRVISERPLVCAADGEAIAEAEQLIGGFAIELWDGDRLVKRFKPKKVRPTALLRPRSKGRRSIMFR
jgi:hypothetical protein